MRNYDNLFCLKGEFESEGLSEIELAGEIIFALRNNLDYLVKFSGSEANSEINYLSRIGVKRIVCPMIESPFAMERYMSSTNNRGFVERGVTIETITAVKNINEIIEAGIGLTNITIGRTDLCRSLGINNVESKEIMTHVKNIALVSKSKDLIVSLGGGVSLKTKKYLTDNNFQEIVDFIETRKAVIEYEKFIHSNAINDAIDLEITLLKKRKNSLDRTLGLVNSRLDILSKRITGE